MHRMVFFRRGFTWTSMDESSTYFGVEEITLVGKNNWTLFLNAGNFSGPTVYELRRLGLIKYELKKEG